MQTRRRAMRSIPVAMWLLVAPSLVFADDPLGKGEMAGYLLFPTERVPGTFNAGFSMYVAAWPLLKTYPGHQFQSGLPGTWMFAQHDGPAPEKAYSDIEGGLGWWRDTRFPTETPKFIMGGVAPEFRAIANGPAHGIGTWEEPRGLYGVAQLSPWLLFPIDGLNISQGTSGELVGYGYLPLPLVEPKTVTAGKDIPTGGSCWTLFLNTRNFKGPVAFFLPYFWSQAAVEEPRLAGKLLDSRPSEPNRALQMETQHIPSVSAVDSKGDRYARIAPTLFPRSPNGDSIVVHQVTSYGKAALWDAVDAWFKGGREATGTIDPRGAVLHPFGGGGGATWRIYDDATPEKERAPVAWNSFVTPIRPDPNTVGFRWNEKHVGKDADGRPLVVLPQYYRLSKSEKKTEWVPIPAEEVPAETGLAAVRFERPREPHPEPYTTPEDADSCWKKPGPVAGPFQARLGDGSVVTYSWYRFADQPALLNADLTPAERERMQTLVEKIHRTWKKDREYLAPPTAGPLADLDPAQIVTPPPGFEIGYVPIATRQELKK